MKSDVFLNTSDQMYLLWTVFVQNQCYSEGQGGFGVISELPNIFFLTLFPAPLWHGWSFCRSFSQLGVLNCWPLPETQSSLRPQVRTSEHTLGIFSPHSFWSSPLRFLGWPSADGAMSWGQCGCCRSGYLWERYPKMTWLPRCKIQRGWSGLLPWSTC